MICEECHKAICKCDFSLGVEITASTLWHDDDLLTMLQRHANAGFNDANDSLRYRFFEKKPMPSALCHCPMTIKNYAGECGVCAYDIQMFWAQIAIAACIAVNKRVDSALADAEPTIAVETIADFVTSMRTHAKMPCGCLEWRWSNACSEHNPLAEPTFFRS